MNAWHHQSPVKEKVGRGGEGGIEGVEGHTSENLLLWFPCEMQPRLYAKQTALVKHLPIQQALRSNIPGIPNCALPLHPPVQPLQPTCLMFRIPWPIRQGVSCLEAHAAVFRGETPNPAEARKTKATQRDPQAAKSTFSSAFPLICCYMHSAQGNVKFLKLFSPSLWKVGSREARTAWLLFQIGSQRRRRWVVWASGGARPIRRKGWTLGAGEAASARIRELARFKWLEAAGNIALSSKNKRWVLFLFHSSGSAQSLTSFGPWGLAFKRSLKTREHVEGAELFQPGKCNYSRPKPILKPLHPKSYFCKVTGEETKLLGSTPTLKQAIKGADVTCLISI